MKEESIEGTILEKKVEDVTVRVIARPNETFIDLYTRFNQVCEEVQNRRVLEDTITRIREFFNFTGNALTKTGINSDYHRVMLSLIFNFNKCMGATEVSNEWGGINTGIVSRVFTGSKESTEKYIGHFEKCTDGKYRFTEVGLKHALDIEL
jgi:hypothetical protein